MDREKLLELEIEETELEAIEDALEEKQNDLEARMDAAESNGNMERKKQLEAELKKVQELLKQVKEEMEASGAEQNKKAPEEKKQTVHGAVPTSIEETESHTVPTSLDGMEVLSDSVENKLKSVKNIFGSRKRETEEEKEERERAKIQEAEEKKHEAELRAKSAQMRKKAADEQKARAKEEEKAAKAAEDAAKEAESEKKSADSENDYDKLFSSGVGDYAAKKYASAFSSIFKVANAGKKSGLETEKLGEAEQLLARMYQNGEGTTADSSRAWFWFEKAAEHKNIEGCLAMGQRNTELMPKSPTEEKEFREKALKYFELAGNAGSKVGKEKFVDICMKKKEQVSNADIKTACRFLDDLIALEDDAYLKQILEGRKKELRDSKQEIRITVSDKKTTSKKRVRNNNKAYNGTLDIVAIIGAFCSLFGVMLFCNHILSKLDTFFNFNWIIPEYFLLNYPITRFYVGQDIIEEFCLLFIHLDELQAGAWAMLFIPFGFFLSGLSHVETRGKIANIFCEISLYLSAIFGFMGFYYWASFKSGLYWFDGVRFVHIYMAIGIALIGVAASLCADVLMKIVHHIKSR